MKFAFAALLATVAASNHLKDFTGCGSCECGPEHMECQHKESNCLFEHFADHGSMESSEGFADAKQYLHYHYGIPDRKDHKFEKADKVVFDGKSSLDEGEFFKGYEKFRDDYVCRDRNHHRKKFYVYHVEMGNHCAQVENIPFIPNNPVIHKIHKIAEKKYPGHK